MSRRLLLIALIIAGSGCVLFPSRPLLHHLDSVDEAIFTIPTERRHAALTIDDGPDPEATPLILDVLAKHGVKATFFLLGEKAEAHPELVEMIVAAGHEIGNHGWRDRRARSLSAEEFEADLRRTENVLADHAAPQWYRPGGGLYSEAMLDVVDQCDYRMVLGSIYPHDAHLHSVAFASKYLEARTRPGDIVVLHDGGERGERTARVLNSVIPKLRERDLELVTLGELAGGRVAAD